MGLLRKKYFWASLCLTSKDEIWSEKFVESATGDVEKIPKNHNKRDNQNETKNLDKV